MSAGAGLTLYFRVREQGAAVFRIDVENRNRRLELHQIATVNARTGEVRPAGKETVTEAERAEIALWVAARQKALAAREEDDLARLADALNTAAHWIASRAPEDVVERHADSLLLAMHDLRAAIVRRKSDMGGGN